MALMLQCFGLTILNQCLWQYTSKLFNLSLPAKLINWLCCRLLLQKYLLVTALSFTGCILWKRTDLRSIVCQSRMGLQNMLLNSLIRNNNWIGIVVQHSFIAFLEWLTVSGLDYKRRFLTLVSLPFSDSFLFNFPTFMRNVDPVAFVDNPSALPQNIYCASVLVLLRGVRHTRCHMIFNSCGFSCSNLHLGNCTNLLRILLLCWEPPPNSVCVLVHFLQCLVLDWDFPSPQSLSILMVHIMLIFSEQVWGLLWLVGKMNLFWKQHAPLLVLMLFALRLLGCCWRAYYFPACPLAECSFMAIINMSWLCGAKSDSLKRSFYITVCSWHMM